MISEVLLQTLTVAEQAVIKAAQDLITEREKDMSVIKFFPGPARPAKELVGNIIEETPLTYICLGNRKVNFAQKVQIGNSIPIDGLNSRNALYREHTVIVHRISEVPGNRIRNNYKNPEYIIETNIGNFVSSPRGNKPMILHKNLKPGKNITIGENKVFFNKDNGFFWITDVIYAKENVSSHNYIKLPV